MYYSTFQHKFFLSYSCEWLKSRNLANPEIKANRYKFYLEDTKLWDGYQIAKKLKKFKHEDFLHNDKVYFFL